MQLIDGFTFGHNQTFIVGLVGETMAGQFRNFNDGDLIGNFGGFDLFIDYRWDESNGNGVFLVTAVPEPGSAFMVAMLAMFMTLRRRSRVPSGMGC